MPARATLVRRAPRARQVCLNERIEIAIEDAMQVADLVARAVILDSLRGMHEVGANLVPELDALALARRRIDGLPLLLELHLVEARLQDAHRHGAVGVLAALVLTRDDEVRRQVRDPDGRVRHVHVLAAGT